MRARKHINLKERKQLELSDFKGVDFSGSPIKIQANRASYAVNFITEDDITRKRHGWNELFKFKNSDDTPAEINLIFQYVDGDYKTLIIYAGKEFYKVDYDKEEDKYIKTNINNTCTYSPAMIDTARLKSQRCQVFLNKGKAYIVGCGDYLVYGSWNDGETYELRRVYNNEDTYIPTTTVSIDNDSVLKDDDTRSDLDDVNFLNSKRKNQMLGIETFPASWTVDANKIDDNSKVEITLETLREDLPVTINITNSKDNKKLLFNEEEEEVGSIDFETGKITLNINTEPQIQDRDNIYILFESTRAGYSDRISNCSFGMLFGVSGNTDRLFISGNSEYPNIDFHSEMDDFTYFGDFNTTAFGSNATAIMGYARLSDSTLVVFKEDNGQEATIFYRTGEYREYSEDGQLQKIQAVFPVSAGSIGEGSVSKYASVNLSGDSLMLSQNGVFGIVLSNNVATVERYAHERSRAINNKLTKHKNLSEAVGIVFKNKYYLAVDGVCYIADARYKYVAESDLDNTFNYEWWYWDNMPVRVWANIENQLYFGTPQGQVCVFDDKFVDRTYYNTEPGDISINISENIINYNPASIKNLKENDFIKFSTDLFELLVAEIIKIEDNKVFVDEDTIMQLFDGFEVYADNVEESGLQIDNKYVIVNVDKDLCCFELYQDLLPVEITAGGFKLYKNLKNQELYVSDIDNGTFKVKNYLTGEVIVLSEYNNIPPVIPLANIVFKQNVVAEWYTPVFDFGTNVFSKTLLNMTLATEPTTNGRLLFGYETKNIEKFLAAKGLNVFSFDDLSFESFSFDTAFASSYTVKTNQRNFNFIMFKFRSDNEYSCAINTFTALYKVNKRNIGVN